MGKNIALKKLRGIAANKIKNGGEILTKLAPLRQGGLVQSAYKSEKVAKSFIPGSTQVGLRPHHIKKKTELRKKKGGKKAVKKGGKKKGGKKVKGGKKAKKGGKKKGGRKIGKKGRKKRRSPIERKGGKKAKKKGGRKKGSIGKKLHKFSKKRF